MKTADPNIDVFDRDARENQGYLYTATTRLSSRLATGRSADVILEMGRFAGRSVLDMGCGDGYYTLRFWDRGGPRALVGVDGSREAVAVAEANKGGRPIRFLVGDAYRLPFPDDSFDLALVQSILHHADRPRAMIREAFRLAPEVLIHEPNGNNFGLKIIEKASRYHREHREKSYGSRRLRRWVREAGGRVVRQRFAGFVPMFCPDRLARLMKGAEPLLERLPLLSALGCAVYVLVARRGVA
jgi:SAM-dependent methyltransferase